MKFLDADGVPTNLYAQYQGGKEKQILAQGIKNAYKHIFDIYPNANNLPKKDMEDYFKTQTGITTSVLDKMVSTFNTLCGLADFSDGNESIKVETRKNEAVKTEDERKIVRSAGVEPNITINIGINIAADTKEDTIKLIFENMKKYLLTQNND